MVIDPEGDFVTLADVFGHIVVDGAAYSAAELTRLAARIREHRASVVLALDGLEIEAQMRCAASSRAEPKLSCSMLWTAASAALKSRIWNDAPVDEAVDDALVDVENVLRRAGALNDSPLLHMYRTDVDALQAFGRLSA